MRKIILLWLWLITLVPAVLAADDCAGQPVDAKVNCYERKIQENQGQQKTLASTITYLDNKMKLTLSQIEKTETDIKTLEEEVNVLTVKISNLDTNLSDVSRLLIARVGEAYKRHSINPTLHLLTSGGLTDFLERAKYLKAAQQNDQKLLLEMQQSRDLSQQQKELKEKKQTDLESLKKQLATQNASLLQQKSAKSNLLEVTKNDEQRYHQLLTSARAEKQALSEIFFQDGKLHISYTIGSLVNRGSIGSESRLGTMGNTGAPGCSSGAHLHLEFITEGKLEGNTLKGVVSNPLNSLQNKTIQWFDDENKLTTINVGGGNNTWPLNNPIITQMFGKTPYSKRYSYDFHTAIDIVDLDNRTVKAISSGTLYNGTLFCNSSSSLINTAIIDHGNGVFSTYLHLDSF